jgi:chitodextrinase
VFHFLLVTVDGSTVTVTPTDELGRTFDVQTYRFGTADTTPPSVPTGLKASPAASSVTLTWVPSTDNVAVKGYRVLRNGKRIATTSVTTSYVDMQVTPSTTYRYRVKAFDAAGNVSAASSPVTVTTPAD